MESITAKSPSPHGCCSSSVVEHSLGKGEVGSSILLCSTISPLLQSLGPKALTAQFCQGLPDFFADFATAIGIAQGRDPCLGRDFDSTLSFPCQGLQD